MGEREQELGLRGALWRVVQSAYELQVNGKRVHFGETR